jgi:hypothetical protein
MKDRWSFNLITQAQTRTAAKVNHIKIVVTKEASIHEFFLPKLFEFMSQGLLDLAEDMKGPNRNLHKCPPCSWHSERLFYEASQIFLFRV